MIIRDKYNALLNRDLKIEDILEINEFKKMCKRENNHEYFYLSNILIIDIYIEEKLYDEALQLALKDINNVDSNIFKNIYLYLLERIIYIYIQKKNYKSAYRYVYRKRNVIDLDNKEEVNRWYLEMSYVYAELNELNRALLNLQAILENYPNDEIKNVALSNMTKIYIDQGMIKEAKETLNQCLEIVIQLNDYEGKIYCDYLLAKIYILEKNYKFAKKIYDEIFKNQDELPIDYLNLVNEYILLLINMGLYLEAGEVVNQYQTLFEDANIYIKKEFYKNKVKLAIYQNGNTDEELDKVLKMIDILDSEIAHSKELVLNEAAEDEKTEEIQRSLKSTIAKLEKAINILTFALNHDDERASLMDFSKRLEEVIVFDEALYVILDRPDNDFIPNFLDSFSQFTSYQYKKDRLYERNHSYQSLINTPIEYIMQNSKEILIDFSESNIPIRDLISTKNYSDLPVKSLVAIPLFHGKDLFGAVIFTSNQDLTTNENVLILKIASQLLEFKLSSLFYQENLRSQRNILQQAINSLQEGLFYFDPKKEKFFLTERLQEFLSLDKKILNLQEYLKLIHENDRNNYLEALTKAISNGDQYEVYYRLVLNDNIIRVQEIANPYITVDGFIKFYIGTVNKVTDLEVAEENLVLGHSNFLTLLESLKEEVNNPEYKFSLVRLRINNINDINLPINKLLNLIASHIIKDFEIKDSLYYLDDETLIFVLDNCIDQRSIDKYIKNNQRNLQNLEVDNRIYSLDIDYAVSRYPRDSVNLDKIYEITNMILQLDDHEIYFNEKTSHNFVQKTVINNCVNEQLNNSLELLYNPIAKNNNLLGYEVRHNIKGLNIQDEYRLFLDQDLNIKLDELTIKQVYNDLRNQHHKVFILVNASLLQALLDSRTLRYNPSNKYMTLVIDKGLKNEKQMINLLEKLISLDFKIGITYTDMINYSILFLTKFSNLIWFNNIESLEFKNFESIIESFQSTVVLDNNIETSYPRAYHRVGKYFRINELNRGN